MVDSALGEQRQDGSAAAVVQQLSTKSFFGYKTQVCCFQRPEVCPVQGCATAPCGPAPASLGEGLAAQPREQSKGMLLDFFRKPAVDNPLCFVNAGEWFLQSPVQCRAGAQSTLWILIKHAGTTRDAQGACGKQQGCFLSQNTFTNISWF